MMWILNQKMGRYQAGTVISMYLNIAYYNNYRTKDLWIKRLAEKVANQETVSKTNAVTSVINSAMLSDAIRGAH
jgi:hypothetical protein